ncbi:MAG: 30S ribosomal protein S20 [Candidatus Portnoybacteria bacterium]|nr:30S ribosomal protein S20 [Candidatus Portnoybacteria bacterium]
MPKLKDWTILLDNMPITKSAKKALRQSRQRRLFNLRRTKKMKSLIKQVRDLLKEKKKEEALKILPQVYKAIDKAAKRGVIKKNTASRKKSRLTKAIEKIK